MEKQEDTQMQLEEEEEKRNALVDLDILIMVKSA